MKVPIVHGGYPIIGQVVDMLKRNPFESIQGWVKEYGPIFCFQLLGRNCVVVTDRELLKMIMHSKMKDFKKDLQFSYKPFLSILGTGLVTSDGKLWRKQRTLLSAAFRIEILDDIPLMAKKAVERLACELEKIRGTGKLFEISERLRHLTLQVIAEAVLSLSPEISDEVFAKVYLPIVTEGNTRVWHPYRAYIPNSAYFHYQKNVKELNDFMTKIIKERWEIRQSGENSKNRTDRKGDILDRILNSIEESEWNDETIRQLRDELKTFILAGHETSASMLTWTVLEISKNPNLYQKMKEEVKMVYGDNYSSETPLPPNDKLDQLEFSLACLKESLRLKSVVPVVSRVTNQDVMLSDYFIPAGTTMILNIEGIHQDENLWPEPMSYRPERFIRTEIKPYSFLPFIDGPRNCLGQNLALLEAKVVLSTLFYRFKFCLESETMKGEKHPWMVPVIPKMGLKVTIE